MRLAQVSNSFTLNKFVPPRAVWSDLETTPLCDFVHARLICCPGFSSFSILSTLP